MLTFLLTLKVKLLAMKNIHYTFGNYIRELRLKAGLGLRELARILEISPSYLKHDNLDLKH